MIYYVEDNEGIRNLVTYTLNMTGFEAEGFAEGSAFFAAMETTLPELILLDVMLPKLTGFEVCQQIREFSNVPVIMLTAKGDDMDKILGLEYGADDYITKPFNILEVKARIKAILRRMEPKKTSAESGGILESGDLKLDRDGRRAYIQRREIGLTAKEFEVLELLMLNPDKVYSRENLLKLVWGTDYPGDVRTVDVHIRRLREKIELSPSEPRYVHTKWGVGYYFNDKLSHGQNA